MDGHDYTFPNYPYPDTLMEEPLFQPHGFQGQGQFSPIKGCFIDPNLQPSPTDAYLSQWERKPPQVERWISDHQRTVLFNPAPYSHAMTPVARSVMAPRPVQPTSQARYASPSDHGLTATSPFAETESFYDHNLPSTPSDTAVLSPSYHSGHLDCHASQEESIQYMGPAAPQTCVKPEDIDPGFHDAEASQPDFTFADPRSLSWHSGTSHTDVDSVQDQIDVAVTHQRMASPEDMRPIKTESEGPSPYSPLPEREETQNVSVPEQKPPAKRKNNDDDDDYTPGKKNKPTTTTSTRRTRARPSPPRRNAASSSVPVRPSTTKATALTCSHCNVSFKDSSTLDSHIKKQHTRPFKCIFDFAGCASTFPSKNEWKRHNSTQHIVPHFWLCTDGTCGKTVNGVSPAASHSSSSSSRPKQQPPKGHYNNTFNQPITPSSPASQLGVRFNRKDLYTQHVRRMHMSPTIKKDLKLFDAARQQQNAASAQGTKHVRKGATGQVSALEQTKAAWEEHLKQRQDAARTDRIPLPEYMRCPAAGCEASDFRGREALDQWMEHVAKHYLEEDGHGRQVEFGVGGGRDSTLIQWAERVGVIVRTTAGGWKLDKVLGRVGDKYVKGEGGVEVGGGEEFGTGYEDAEGEDDDL